MIKLYGLIGDLETRFSILNIDFKIYDKLDLAILSLMRLKRFDLGL